MLEAVCSAFVQSLSFFNDISQIAEDDTDCEALVFRLREYLDEHTSTLENALKTDQYEGRIAYMEQELKKLDLLVANAQQLDSLTYHKRVQIGDRIEMLAASTKQDLARFSEPISLKKKPIARRNLSAASFIDNI